MSLFLGFVRESNMLSGIRREPSLLELESHDRLVGSRARMPDIVEFVSSISSHNLRSGVSRTLNQLLDQSATLSPYRVHCLYRYLRPFDGCNGRSSRALWLWMMYHHSSGSRAAALRDGFLATYYCQSHRAFAPQRKKDTDDSSVSPFRPDGNYKKFPCVCGSEFSRVLSSRPQPEGYIRRRRGCVCCGRRVTTIEKPVGEMLLSSAA